MSRHIQVTFDAHDPRALSSFWRDVLGYVHPGPPGVDLPEDADPLAAWDDFLARIGVPEEQRNTRSAIEDPDGHGPRLFFQQVPEDKVAKNRVHLDVRAAPGLQGVERMAALEVECDRLVALGATRVRRFEPEPPMSAGFIVMRDPEGNEFCLLAPCAGDTGRATWVWSDGSSSPHPQPGACLRGGDATPAEPGREASEEMSGAGELDVSAAPCC